MMTKCSLMSLKTPSNYIKHFIFLVLIFLIASTVYAKNKQLEKEYQKDWCVQHSGQTEARLHDGTRVDCLTDKHAIEFDFGKKWAESIGQSLYYSIQTNKKPGIVLILERPKDVKYWYMLNTIIFHYELNIDVWKIENFKEQQ